MTKERLPITPKFIPPLDPDFHPASLFNRAYRAEMERSGQCQTLVLGIERSDLTLIERGLADRLHQTYRRPLYERSIEVVEAARDLGALGATISGAGPSVLVWSYWQSSGDLVSELEGIVGGWAEVRRVPFSPLGAEVEL